MAPSLWARNARVHGRGRPRRRRGSDQAFPPTTWSAYCVWLIVGEGVELKVERTGRWLSARNELRGTDEQGVTGRRGVAGVSGRQ